MKWDLVPRNGRKQGNICGSSCKKRECKEISKEDSTTIFTGNQGVRNVRLPLSGLWWMKLK